MLSNPSQAQRGDDHLAPGVDLAGLGNRFIGLLGRKWSRRSFAAEMAKLLTDAARTKATAILGYERRSGSLTLLADHGLPDEARAALSSGTDGAWDIPLRGLQNRRISVIEAAHQNPFVPRNLTSFCPTGLSIVALPLYYDYEPVGVVLLFAGRSRSFSDAQLQTLSQALRVCGRGLRDPEIPAPRALAAGADAEAAPTPAEPAASTGQAPPALRLLQGERAGRPRAEAAEGPGMEAQLVEQELAQAQAEMRRRSEAVRSVAAATRALKSERDRLAQQLTELEYLRDKETGQLRAQLSNIEERLLAVESERLRSQRAADAKREHAEQALQALQVERDTLLARLHTLESSDTEVQAKLNRLHEECNSLTARNEILTRELEAAHGTLEAERTRVTGDVARLEGRLEETRRLHAAREQELDSVITAQQSELQKVTAQLQQQLDERTATLTTQEQVLASLRAQLERMGVEQQQTRQALENALAAAHAQIERLKQDASTLREQLAQRDAESARFRAESDQARQAEAALHQSTATLREEIATLTARLDQSVAAAAAREEELSTTLSQVQAEAAALRQASDERDALARAADDLGDKAAGLERTVAALNQQAATARAECARAEQRAAELSAQLAAAEHDHEQARAQRETALEELGREQQRSESERRQAIAEQTSQRDLIAQLQAAVEQACAERQQALEQVEQLNAQTETNKREIDQLKQRTAEREEAAAAATAECTQLRHAVRTAEAAAAAAAAETEDLRQTVRDAMQRLEQERRQHAAEIEALLAEAAVPIASGAPEAATDTSELPQPTELREETAERKEEPLIIERAAPLAAATESVAEVAEGPAPAIEVPRTAAAMGELILLDQGPCGEQACAALGAAGFEVTLLPFGEAAVEELARRKLKCIMLNLAAGPTAWRTLKLLREGVGTRNVPILAYVMTPDAPMGFCFGRTDFALWPLESGRMIERLGRLRPKLQRLLAVTSDVDGMGRLREPLARAKISTSIVLDARQVLDFASMIDPEAAILHLSPSCPSAARAILALRGNDATRELPLLVLLDKAGGNDEESFFAQASRQLLGKAGFQFSRLPEEIARLIG